MPYGQEGLALLLWRITHIGVIFIAVFWLHFVYAWLNIKRRGVIIFAYVQAIFFSLLNFYDLLVKSSPGLFIPKATWVFNSLYWDTHYKPDFYWPYFVIWFFWVVYAHYELFRHYRKSSGVKRAQIKYFFFAFVAGYGGGTTSYLPCFGIPFYPYFNATIPLYPTIMAYAIIRYRLMDVRMIMGKLGVFLSSFLIILSYFFSLFYLNSIFKIVSPLVFGVFVVVTVIPLFYYFHDIFEKLAAKYFYYTIYSLKQTIQRLGRELNKTIMLNDLTNLISASLADSLKLEKAAIVLKQEKEHIFRVQQAIKFKEKELDAFFQKENFFIDYLRQTKESLIREEIPYLIEKTEKGAKSWEQEEIREKKEKLKFFKQELDKLEIGLGLPLFVGEELIGIIILGNKLSGEAYTVQDLDLLSILSSQAALAFNNALSYEEIERRRAELEKFYKLTVGRELKMAELKERIKALEGRVLT